MKRIALITSLIAVASLAFAAGALAEEPVESASSETAGVVEPKVAMTTFAASASLNGCSVSVGVPYIWVGVSGQRYAKASVRVSCSTSRTLIVNAQILEDDTTGDDPVTSIVAKGLSIEAGGTESFSFSGVCKNFDPTGSEELYTKAKINVGGVNSAWARSANLSTTC